VALGGSLLESTHAATIGFVLVIAAMGIVGVELVEAVTRQGFDLVRMPLAC
jgi:hypothetical protein